MSSCGAPLHRLPQLGLGVLADLVVAQPEPRQRAVDAERIGDGGGARVADLVAAEVDAFDPDAR